MPQRRTGDCQTPRNRLILRSQAKASRPGCAAGSVLAIVRCRGLKIYNYSLGSARLTNKACKHCLMIAAQHERKIVDDYLVRDVI